MRAILSALLALLTLTISFGYGAIGQKYTPKPGETVLRMEVEGRGNIYVLLRTKEAPKTTAHVLALVRSGFYDGQRFHRVDRNPKPFLVAIGDPASKTGDIENAGAGGSGDRVAFEETPFKNGVGAVGLMRNTQDPDSGDCQFYMLLDRSSFLDGTYCVFGQVVVGLDVLKKIQRGDRAVRITILRAGLVRQGS